MRRDMKMEQIQTFIYLTVFYRVAFGFRLKYSINVY